MNGQMDIFSIGKEPLKITKPIRLIELFAGIGSQAKALERIGVEFEHYRVCEFDPYAITSYNAVHGKNFKPSDITNWQGEDLGICDVDRFTYLLTYSFPCTDLSVAGAQKGMEEGSGTRSALLWEVKRLLEETKELPQILLMENVPQVASGKNRQHFNKWIDFLSNLGYVSKWQILNSKDYKIPQNRERCFMVSWLGDYDYNFPLPTSLDKKMRDFLEAEEEIDKKYYLSEKGVNYLFRKMPYLHKANSKNSSYDSVIRPPHGWNGGEWKQSDIIPTIDTGVENWHILLGTSNIQLYDVYNGKQIDETCIGTITSACSHNGSGTFCVKNGKSPVRRVTPKECWRFMNFDDTDYENAQKALNEKFYNGKDKSGSQLYKQAGNSIVVAVLEAIFKEMI